MSDFDSGEDCPLCVEPMDEADRAYRPCKCGFGVCLFCWHKICNTGNGLCPACRSPYDATNYKVLEVDVSKPVKRLTGKSEPRKQKPAPSYAPSAYAANRVTSASREALRDVRVIQRNLVYVVGLNPAITREEVLRRPEYFGQYGRVMKVVGNRNYIPATDGRPASASAYVTFYTLQAAADAIRACDAFPLDDRTIHCSFGTSKYCHQYLRGNTCTNPECLYLHEVGNEDDSFTKEDMQMQSRQAFHDLTHPPPFRGPPGSGPDAPPLPPAPSAIRPKGQTVLPSLAERYYGVGVAIGCGFVPYSAPGEFESERASEDAPRADDNGDQQEYNQAVEYEHEGDDSAYGDENASPSTGDAQDEFPPPSGDTEMSAPTGDGVLLNGVISPVETVTDSSLGKSLGGADIWLPPESVGLLGGDLLSGTSTPGGIGGDVLLGGSHPGLNPHVLSGIAGLGLSLPTFTPAPLAEELSFVNDLSALLSSVGGTTGFPSPAPAVSNGYPQAHARPVTSVESNGFSGHSSMFTPLQSSSSFGDVTRFPSVGHHPGGHSQSQARIGNEFSLPSLSSPPRHPQHSMIDPEPLLMRGASSYGGGGYPQHHAQSYDHQRQRQQGLMGSPGSAYRSHYVDRDGYSVDTVSHSSPQRPSHTYTQPHQQFRQFDPFSGDTSRFDRPTFGFDDSARRFHDPYQRSQGPMYGELHSDHSMPFRDPAILHAGTGSNPPTPLRNVGYLAHHAPATDGPSLQDLLSSIVGSSTSTSSVGPSYSLDPVSQRLTMPRRESLDQPQQHHAPLTLHFSSLPHERTPPMQPATFPHSNHGGRHDEVLSFADLAAQEDIADPPTPIVTGSAINDDAVIRESHSPTDNDISPKSVTSEDGIRPAPVNTSSSRPPVSLARRSPNMYIPPKRTVTTDNGNVITTVISQPSADVIIAEAIPASSGASGASRSSGSAATRTSAVKPRGVYKPGQHTAAGTYITTATVAKPVVIELNVPAPVPPAPVVEPPVIVLPSSKPAPSTGRGGKSNRGGKR